MSYQCPRCGSKNLSRRYASFWAPVNEESEDAAQILTIIKAPQSLRMTGAVMTAIMSGSKSND